MFVPTNGTNWQCHYGQTIACYKKQVYKYQCATKKNTIGQHQHKRDSDKNYVNLKFRLAKNAFTRKKSDNGGNDFVFRLG